MLELHGVEVSYGHVRALQGISIDVREGELVALLGANGAGKSSTLMTISGIVRPLAGTVRFGDTDLAKAAPYDIVGMGIIQCPEGRRIFGSLSVQENLRMGAIRRADRTRVRSDMEYVYSLFPVLGERRRQAGATLSGGEQQMLAIGRSLMAEPRLLLLDEPSLGLAPIVVQAIFRVIQELRSRKVTVLLVEQNVRQALAVADRAYVLETGSVVMSGTGPELRANPEIERAYLSGTEERGQ